MLQRLEQMEIPVRFWIYDSFPKRQGSLIFVQEADVSPGASLLHCPAAVCGDATSLKMPLRLRNPRM